VPDPGPCDLSIVLLAPDTARTTEPTLAALARQRGRERLEVILVSGREGDPSAIRKDLREALRIRMEPLPAPFSIGAGYAHGIRRASAPVVALAEDHAFPEPGWAEAICAAVREPDVGAVGSTMVNANPGSALSWGNLLVAYGRWSEGTSGTGGEMDALPGANLAYVREAVLRHDGELAALLDRGGGLNDRLRADGYRLVLAPGARTRHQNVSRLAATAKLRYNAGRLYAARRAEGWAPRRRRLYAALSPAIPPVRLVRELRALRARGRARNPREVAGLAVGLVFDGAGQLAGFARGEGAALRTLAAFEFQRDGHLRRADRR